MLTKSGDFPAVKIYMSGGNIIQTYYAAPQGSLATAAFPNQAQGLPFWTLKLTSSTAFKTFFLPLPEFITKCFFKFSTLSIPADSFIYLLTSFAVGGLMVT